MEEDERAQRANKTEDDQPEWWLGKHQCAPAFISVLAQSRVERSISSTSPIERGATKSASTSASWTTFTMSGKRIAPARKLATATSFAALRTIGAAPPRSTASRASRNAGKRTRAG